MRAVIYRKWCLPINEQLLRNVSDVNYSFIILKKRKKRWFILIDVTNRSVSSSKSDLNKSCNWILQLLLRKKCLGLITTDQTVSCNCFCSPAEGALVLWFSKLKSCLFLRIFCEITKCKNIKLNVAFLIMTWMTFIFRKTSDTKHTYNNRWCCETNVCSIPLST